MELLVTAKRNLLSVRVVSTLHESNDSRLGVGHKITAKLI